MQKKLIIYGKSFLNLKVLFPFQNGKTMYDCRRCVSFIVSHCRLKMSKTIHVIAHIDIYREIN